MKRTILTVLGLAALTAGGILAYLVLRKPAKAPALAIKVEITPARLERGKYLFDVVADCAGCHSQRDFTRFAGPIVHGTEGQGFVFPPELGFPGTIVAPNITPDVETGIGSWTDGEKIRAIRDGVSKDGKALFPLMPYEYFRSMSDEDVYSLVAYMNTLPPRRNRLGRTELNFPVNLLIKGVPRPAGSVAHPDRGDRMAYGKYLTTIATCGECHTPAEGGKRNSDMAFAGGREFRIGPYLVNSANMTPDRDTGIGAWTQERFVSKFTGYRNLSGDNVPKASQANFTVMPWLALSRMEDEDIKAIYAYLRTAPAKVNSVTVHP
jgi:mono/diheme cytochrome c family protein